MVCLHCRDRPIKRTFSVGGKKFCMKCGLTAAYLQPVPQPLLTGQVQTRFQERWFWPHPDSRLVLSENRGTTPLLPTWQGPECVDLANRQTKKAEPARHLISCPDIYPEVVLVYNDWYHYKSTISYSPSFFVWQSARPMTRREDSPSWLSSPAIHHEPTVGVRWLCWLWPYLTHSAHNVDVTGIGERHLSWQKPSPGVQPKMHARNSHKDSIRGFSEDCPGKVSGRSRSSPLYSCNHSVIQCSIISPRGG